MLPVLFINYKADRYWKVFLHKKENNVLSKFYEWLFSLNLLVLSFLKFFFVASLHREFITSFDHFFFFCFTHERWMSKNVKKCHWLHKQHNTKLFSLFCMNHIPCRLTENEQWVQPYTSETLWCQRLYDNVSIVEHQIMEIRIPKRTKIEYSEKCSFPWTSSQGFSCSVKNINCRVSQTCKKVMRKTSHNV